MVARGKLAWRDAARLQPRRVMSASIKGAISGAMTGAYVMAVGPTALPVRRKRSHRRPWVASAWQHCYCRVVPLTHLTAL